MDLFDTHAHFDDFAEEGVIEDVLKQARAADVARVLAIGGNPSANRLALRLADAHAPMLGCACGFDRDQADAEPDESELRACLQSQRCVAVGECGLDYHYQPDSAAAQRTLFELNLALALELELPVVVHSRDADDDTLAMLREYARTCDPSRKSIGVLHCYTRGKDMARELLDIGFHISFSGIVTFKNADMLRAVAAYLPSDRIVIETDSPYLAPEPMRGRRNQPALIAHIARRLAELRSTSVEDFAAVSTRNARQLFGMDADE